jgi:ribonuclease HI
VAATSLKEVTLVTDGAGLGNPGPGGWAALLRSGPHYRELYGCTVHTTNNRMELTAALEGLRALKQPCRVTIVTDSEYLRQGITEWIHAWKRNGWKTKGKDPVKNQDLWEALDAALERHEVNWRWVKGHATHADNNRADKLASDAAKLQIHT